MLLIIQRSSMVVSATMTKAKQRKGQNGNTENAKGSKKFDYTDNDFRTREIVTRIKFLQDLVDTYVQKTEKEKVKIADLQKQIKVLDEMHKKKYNAATETSLQNAKRESRRVINRIVNQLENSLNCMLQKKGAEEQFQETQKKLINDYRIERRGLGENTKMLERKLEVAKSKLRRIMEDVNSVLVTRLATEEHMKTLKNQIAETENRFESDWGQLNEIILAERKKTQEIQIEENNELEWYWDRDAFTQRIDERDLKEEMALEEARMETAAKVEEKQKFEQAKVRALRFEKRVAEIKSQLKINNMSELIETFSTREKNIFALMQHINSLTSEAEFLETHVRENKEEIDKLKGASKKRSEMREMLMRDLEKRSAVAKKSIHTTAEKINAAANILSRLQDCLKYTFDEIHCIANIPAAEQLCKVNMTESSMMSFLGVIQQRTNQVLTMYEHFLMDQATATKGSGELSINNRENLDVLELSSKRKPQRPRKKSGYNVHMDKIAGIDEKLEQKMKDKTNHMIAEGAKNRFLMDRNDNLSKDTNNKTEVIDQNEKNKRDDESIVPITSKDLRDIMPLGEI